MLGCKQSLTTFQDVYKRGQVVELYYSLGSHVMAKPPHPVVILGPSFVTKKISWSLNIEDQTSDELERLHLKGVPAGRDSWFPI